ncbi:hypothetical protein Bpfe_009087 [Biomphalaria pfeifferi]|uniref:Uncharacterized protein n=1 Tax=Biomphalaria pfeifferi TaxID=112525 RepID=A0AAD8BW83_BIOPF|nr:hypothetical protein Bpfe_009087 [Biomphalaria pfeifferi]
MPSGLTPTEPQACVPKQGKYAFLRPPLQYYINNVFQNYSAKNNVKSTNLPNIGQENTKENNSNKKSAIGTTTTEARKAMT